MASYKMIIGIDPDVDKSGFAIFIIENKQLILCEFDLQDLFNKLLTYNQIYKDTLLVRLESGHKLKQTWQRKTPGALKDVGRNNEIGSQIEKFMIKNNILFESVLPFGGSKVNHETFCKITGWNSKKRTNPETRVAGLLAYKQF